MRMIITTPMTSVNAIEYRARELEDMIRSGEYKDDSGD